MHAYIHNTNLCICSFIYDFIHLHNINHKYTSRGVYNNLPTGPRTTRGGFRGLLVNKRLQQATSLQPRSTQVAFLCLSAFLHSGRGGGGGGGGGGGVAKVVDQC